MLRHVNMVGLLLALMVLSSTSITEEGQVAMPTTPSGQAEAHSLRDAGENLFAAPDGHQLIKDEKSYELAEDYARKVLAAKKKAAEAEKAATLFAQAPSTNSNEGKARYAKEQKMMKDKATLADKANIDSKKALREASAAVRQSQAAAAVLNDDEKMKGHAVSNKETKTAKPHENTKKARLQSTPKNTKLLEMQLAEVKDKEAELTALVKDQMMAQDVLKHKLKGEMKREANVEQKLDSEIHSRADDKAELESKMTLQDAKLREKAAITRSKQILKAPSKVHDSEDSKHREKAATKRKHGDKATVKQSKLLKKSSTEDSTMQDSTSGAALPDFNRLMIPGVN